MKIPVLEISTGASRFETRWKNTRMTWQSLVEKLATPHRTHELFAQYQKAERKDKDRIKDIGGFVGGYIIGGNRKAGAVAYRTVLTLDADDAAADLWQVFTALYDVAAVCYSTHSHSPEKPRYRLVIPFNRQVKPEEYQPIGRAIAGLLGIEQFDHTGFQDERLMYWPSCSKDGVYEFYQQEGPALDADEVLSSYTNWRDVSEWAVSEKVDDLIRRNQKKQGDPLEKKGIVGAFCRTYTITEAIDRFLSDVYEATDKDDRYTYVHSSTAAGLVLYEDKWAFSHHGTDPISGKLCNAFDLVRLHLYGEDDKQASRDTPPDKLPSYGAMRELAMQDDQVRKQIGIERIEQAREEFADVAVEIMGEEAAEAELTPEDTDWLGELAVDERGSYKHTIDNVVLILENDRLLRGCMAYDEFRNTSMLLKRLPWRVITEDTNEWTDNDDAALRWYIEKVYGISSLTKVRDAVEVVLKRHATHPVREYLQSLKWDGTARIDTLLIDYFDVEDTLYHRAVMRKSLVAAVARVMRPGIKYDYMLVLKGPQGYRKSMFIDILGGEWYSDTLTTMEGKDAYEQVQGSWIIEVAELATMNKVQVESCKHFISKRKDRFRGAWKRNTATVYRQCIFIGTTNKDGFLRDATGGRRFWPVEVQKKLMKVETLKKQRDQIWAEAYELYKGGQEKLYLSGEVEAEAEALQEHHTETDDRTVLVAEYLDKLLPANWESMTIYNRREYLNGDDNSPEGVNQRRNVTAYEVYTELFGGSPKDFSLKVSREINDMLRQFKDWEYTAFRYTKGKLKSVKRGFVRKDDALQRYNSFLD